MPTWPLFSVEPYLYLLKPAAFLDIFGTGTSCAVSRILLTNVWLSKLKLNLEGTVVQVKEAADVTAASAASYFLFVSSCVYR